MDHAMNFRFNKFIPLIPLFFVLLFLILAPLQASHTDNLVSYWSFDEVSGTRNDSEGSNHLTDNGTVTTADGKQNSSADFDDSNNEYLSHASNSDFQTGDVDFTWAGWIYIENKPSKAGIIPIPLIKA